MPLLNASGRLPWPLVFQVLGIATAVWLVVNTWQLWLLVIVSLIIASAMLPTARRAERYRIPRGVTVLLIYLVAAGLLALMGRLLWPALSEQGRQFMDQLPRMLDNVKGWFGDFQTWIAQWGASVPEPKGGNVEGVVGSVLANTLSVTTGVVGMVIEFVAILVIAMYIVSDAEHLGQWTMRLFPPRQREMLAEIGEPVVDRMGAYVRGQLAVSACVGIFLAAALSLLGVRYALLIGALAAVLNVVPWVGSLIASVLGVLSALNDSSALALGTVGVFVASNLIEGKLLVPYLVGRATGLHHLAVLIALLAGVHLAGLVGALVAVPITAAVWEVVERLYVRRLPR